MFIFNIYKLVSGSVYFHHINVFLASAALNSLTTSFFLASVTHGSVFLQGFVFGFLVASDSMFVILQFSRSSDC